MPAHAAMVLRRASVEARLKAVTETINNSLDEPIEAPNYVKNPEVKSLQELEYLADILEASVKPKKKK